MANLTVDVNWQISSEGKEEIGNSANRFDTWRQGNESLGPNNPMADSGPPETDGNPSTP